MLSELRLELESSEKLSVYMSSNFHGVIMETIDSSYAEKLHELKLNPYSQHLEIKDKIEWVICTHSEEAFKEIILPILNDDFCEFDIKDKRIHIKVKGKQLKKIPRRSLFDEFINGTAGKFITIDFVTPTSFKRNGGYVIYPDLELIYKSLMNKYNSTSDNFNMYDEDTLEELLDKSYITKYNLRSCYMPLENVKINSFIGNITIKISGNDTLSRYIKMLFEFGEFSGVGIKCSIGMGAIKVVERGVKGDK